MTIVEEPSTAEPTDGRPEVRSRRAYTWLACREKACCTRAVAVTGADVARIAHGVAVEPWQFAELAPTPASDPAGVAMDGGPDRQALVLRRTGGDCVFLVRTRSGAGRCGLGALAPTACRMFPATVGEADPGPEVCTCREWTMYEIEGEDTASLRRQAIDERQAWHDTVRRWNDFASSAGPEAALAPPDLLRYALDVQATLDERTDW
jgi:Fe-S-cluster containining protein